MSHQNIPSTAIPVGMGFLQTLGLVFIVDERPLYQLTFGTAMPTGTWVWYYPRQSLNNSVIYQKSRYRPKDRHTAHYYKPVQINALVFG